MHLPPTDPSNTSPSGAANVPALSTTRDWTCPFCPLLCDDLVVNAHGDATLSVPDTECPRLDDALTRAARILSNARRPLFGALATDVAGARALYTLAAGCGAILDHLHGDAMSAATLALQDRGSFFTTLSEVRSRADLLVFFGCQPSRRYPRFYARTLEGTEAMRDLVFVGCAPDPAAAGFAQARVEAVLPDADPYHMLAQWSALSVGREPGALRDDGTGMSETLATLAALQ